jgi:hypothetical protein
MEQRVVTADPQSLLLKSRVCGARAARVAVEELDRLANMDTLPVANRRGLIVSST